MQSPKATPRFLPTLTEVVKPAVALEVADSTPPEVATVPAATASDEALVEALVQRLLPGLEQRLQTALRDSLQTQWDALLPKVMEDVEDALRDMAASAVKSAHSEGEP